MRQRTPPHILRRRRIFALVVLALVIWLIWSGVAALIGMISGTPANKASKEIANCQPGAVSVTAFVGDGINHQTVFDSKTQPLLWFTLVNNGKVACYFNAGSKVQTYTIKAGEETIWTNDQCDRSADTNQKILLKPGKVEKANASPWYRVYSNAGGCGEGQVAALPGIYTFTVEVDGVINSNAENFTLK